LALAEDSSSSETIPVFEEKLRVDKAKRDIDRVTIRTIVSERTEYADLELKSSDLVVERVPINRVVEAVPSVRQEGDTVIVPVIEEIMVVEKRFLLKEEIRVSQRPVLQHVREPVVLRPEEVSVSRKPPHTQPEQQEKL
jgi:uncharacterized protein (TIGR02271 family)